MDRVTRRKFVGAAAAWPAASYARIVGANDRIQIGQLGCGHRASGHRRMLKLSAQTDSNFDLRSVCDLWSVNRQRAADDVKRLFATQPRMYKYSEEMLADPELDAVMIGTGDHQHARLLAEVVRAGKDCYCEKPMANTVEDAKLARDTVMASKQVVQMGSQRLSCPYQHAVRDMVRSGKLGKIVSISQSWNFNGPRWHVPKSEDVAALREQETDWNRWLLGRRERPFDPRVYFEFRIFKDFSGGITDQWYSHGSGLAHFYLDTFIPDDTVANGGIFAWHDVRENPDTFQCAPPSPGNRSCTRTALPLATAGAITRSSVGPTEPCIRRVVKAARNGGLHPKRKVRGSRMWLLILVHPPPSRSWSRYPAIRQFRQLNRTTI